MIVLEAHKLRKYYGEATNWLKALKDVSLRVEEGEFLAIVGTSGSGKSTLLHLLGGLDKPTAGEVLIEGERLYQLTDDERTIFRRRKIGFVFQQYNLLPLQNVYENIVLPLRLDGHAVDEGFIDEILVALNLSEKKFALPQTLSGGQSQRVAIARALATKPAIILADEPTGNLDSKTTMDVMGLLKTSSQKFGQTIIMITHELEIAQLADRIIRIEDGQIQGETVND